MSSSSEIFEHILLFHVKDDTDPSKVNEIVNEIINLKYIPQVLYLTAGRILRLRSSAFKFTIMLHSQIKSKEYLADYDTHPIHNVVRQNVLPFIDDILAIDWIHADLEGPVVVKPGSAMRVTFLKLKEGLEETGKSELLRIIRGNKGSLGSIDQFSFGENFTPARAKGFSIASLGVFPGLNELDALDSNKEMAEFQKEVREYLDDMIVVDYVIPPPQPTSL